MYEYSAKVMRVVDGDTIDVDIDHGFGITSRKRLRLFGVDAPETYGVKKESEEYEKGLAAKVWLDEMIGGKQVVVHTSKDRTGKFGRYLAKVYLPSGEGSIGLDVIAEMVEAGHAVPREY